MCKAPLWYLSVIAAIASCISGLTFSGKYIVIGSSLNSQLSIFDGNGVLYPNFCEFEPKSTVLPFESIYLPVVINLSNSTIRFGSAFTSKEIVCLALPKTPLLDQPWISKTLTPFAFGLPLESEISSINLDLFDADKSSTPPPNLVSEQRILLYSLSTRLYILWGFSASARISALWGEDWATELAEIASNSVKETFPSIFVNVYFEPLISTVIDSPGFRFSNLFKSAELNFDLTSLEISTVAGPDCPLFVLFLAVSPPLPFWPLLVSPLPAFPASPLPSTPSAPFCPSTPPELLPGLFGPSVLPAGCLPSLSKSVLFGVSLPLPVSAGLSNSPGLFVPSTSVLSPATCLPSGDSILFNSASSLWFISANASFWPA